MKKRVSVEEADNGYTVSCYDQNGEKKMVCKTIDEVHDAVSNMMGKGATRKDRVKKIVGKLRANKKK